MAVRMIQTAIVECDACRERFGDVVELSSDLAICIASAHGWRIGIDGENYCPECAAKGMGQMSKVLTV